MAYYPNQNGNGAQPPFANPQTFAFGQQAEGKGGNGQGYGNGGYGHGYGDGGYGQAYGNGGYEQQLGNGVYGQLYHNNLNRQQHDQLGTGQQHGGYGFQTQQPQPNGTNGTNRPYRIAPNVMEQHPGGQGFQTQVRPHDGTIATKYANRTTPNANAQPFVPRREATNAKAQPSVPHEAESPKPEVKVLYGDPNIAARRSFWVALNGPPLLGNADKRQDNLFLNSVLNHIFAGMTFSEKCNREADAGCMTPSSVNNFWQSEARKQQAAQQQALRPIPTPIRFQVDLQNNVGKVRTGKSVYVIVGVIQDRGDQMRMSNGIFLVQHPNTSLRVAKFVKVETDAQMERARAERDILMRLKDAYSPHINFMYECHWPNGDDHCVFILDYCDGGSIEKLILAQQHRQSRFSEGFLWHFIHHMCSALALCHNGVRNPLKKEHQSKTWSCIAHLDIKPGNVFYSKSGGKGLEDDEYPTIILGDFGCAVTADEILNGKFPKRGQPFGTAAWYPPEGRTNVGKHAGRYGKSTDIWQLGALVVCMCRLALIPDFDKLYSAQPCGPGYSSKLNTVVKWCLDYNIEKRPSAVDIVERMKAWKKIVVEGESSDE